MASPCGICGDTEEVCPHFLVCLDQTFGEIEGGKVWKVVVPALCELADALELSLRRNANGEIAPSPIGGSYALDMLVEGETESAAGTKAEDLYVGASGGSFVKYLETALMDVSDCQNTEEEPDSAPGMSSHQLWYWSNNPAAAAESVARLVRGDAAAVREAWAVPARKRSRPQPSSATGKKTNNRPAEAGHRKGKAK